MSLFLFFIVNFGLILNKFLLKQIVFLLIPSKTAALKSLVRRLKRKQDDPGAIENLLRAVRDEDSDTACVCIQRSLDGRMQVRNQKKVPHVIFFQIFRDSSLRTYHDLSPNLTCRYSYGMLLKI